MHHTKKILIKIIPRYFFLNKAKKNDFYRVKTL